MSPFLSPHTRQNRSENPSSPKYIGLLILVFFVFILGWNVGVNHRVRQNETLKNESPIGVPASALKQIDMTLFWDTWDILNNRYVDPEAIDFQKMFDGAIHGLVASL